MAPPPAVPDVIPVSNAAQMEQMIMTYAAQGFEVAARSDSSTLMIKKKQLNMVYVVLGLVICVIPLFVYLYLYSKEQDQVVEIRLVPEGEEAPPGLPRAGPPGTADAAAAGAAHAPPPQLSPDGSQWWDGTQWHPITTR